jgi:hypothetical protein
MAQEARCSICLTLSRRICPPLFAEDQEARPSTLACLNTLLERGEARSKPDLLCPLKGNSSTLILAAAWNKLLMIGIAR